MSKKTLRISARDFSIILGCNPYETAFELLEKKIENKHPFFGNKFTEHGNKYEKIAIEKYSELTNNKVNNCNVLVHPNFDWICGKPDGITENNCILEVKCPWKKKEDELTMDNVPIHYWCQVQVYMNILNTEIGHYVEYYKDKITDSEDFRFVPVIRDRNWWNLSINTIKNFYDEMLFYQEKGNLNNHPVRIANNLWENSLKK